MKRLLVVVCCCLSLTGVAMAQDRSGEAVEPGVGSDHAEKPELSPLQVDVLAPPVAGPNEQFEVELDLDYLWDGGALPFVYGSAAVALGIRLFVTPSASPRLFPSEEGGAMVRGDTVPEVALGLGAAAGAGLIAIMPSVGRWHHLKGYGEALLTTIALTEIVKNAVGRHRPSYQVGDTDPDLRRSFFSGHSSVTSVSTLYLGLYLHEYILPRVRGPYAPVIRLLSYGALGAAFVGVPYSRLHDNRHNLSDVATGAVVGSAMAASFYAYQETRLRNREEAFYRGKRERMMLLPDVQNRGLVLTSVW